MLEPRWLFLARRLQPVGERNGCAAFGRLQHSRRPAAGDADQRQIDGRARHRGQTERRRQGCWLRVSLWRCQQILQRFFERLGFERSGYAAGTDPDPVVVYDYKARAYEPRNGRFLQRDPMEFGDGYGLYEYVGGRPRSSSDPTGEFEFSILGILGGSATAQELQSDWGQEVGDVALTLRDVIENLHGDYVLDQAFDGDWAGDWSASDYAYSRAGIEGAFFDHFTPQIDSGSTPKALLIAGRLRAADRFSSLLRKTLKVGEKLHHIATPYGENGRRLRALFKNAGMKLGDAANALPLLGHTGPHAQAYHDTVIRKLSAATAGLTGAEYKAALQRALAALAKDIKEGLLLLND